MQLKDLWARVPAQWGQIALLLGVFVAVVTAGSLLVALLTERFGWVVVAALSVVALALAVAALLLLARRQRTLHQLYDQVRQELRTSEAEYHTIFEKAGDGILILDAAGRHLDANARYCSMLGRTRDEIADISLNELASPPSEGTPDPLLSAYSYLQAAQPGSCELRLAHRNGTWLPVEVTVAALDGGRSLVIMHDISERKQTETALRKSREKLQTLFEVLPVGVSIVDSADRVQDTNPVLPQILRLTEAGILHGAYANRRYFRADGSPMPPGEFPSQRAIREQRTIRDVEIGVEIEDGTLIWTSVSATPLSPSGLSATVTVDITERKRAEDALRQSEARLRAIIENTHNMIWSVDRDYRLIIANAVFDRLIAAQLGRPLAAGESVLHASYPGALNAFWLTQYDRALGGESFVIEIESHATRGGTLECHMNPIRDPDGAVVGAAGLTIDITKQKLAAQILQDTNAELERRVAARTAELQETIAELHRANAGKDAFMAVVSHELRTPLTGILAMSEVLQSQGRDALTSRQARYVDMIRTSGERLLDTVNSVLLYTSLAGGKYTFQHAEFRLADVCAEAVQALHARAAAKSQHIALAVVPEDLAIHGDAAAVVRVLQILLDNAVKFTPAGGALGVEARQNLDDNAGTVCLVVWDTGIGIAPEQQAHLFDPFTQVDQSLTRQFEGVGVGLASVQQIVTLLGGLITLQSEPGRGSRFTVTLPRTPAQV